MDALILSRIQFGLNASFHFIFPSLSIGISLFLVIMEGLYLKTKNPKYKDMTLFWIQIFALTFAIGVATGLVLSFAFGTNWARYSRFVGDVFGSALAAEGIFAFFLEAGFLGILLFGWNRVSRKFHYLANILVCLGAHFSAVWILVANSWMQTPAGYKIVEEGGQKRAVVVDFWKMVFNPSTLDRLSHVLIGCWLAGAFFLVSVSAFYLLRQKYLPTARSMMRIGLFIAISALVLQLVSGDSSARLIAKYQPAKLAAFEGIYKTEPKTPVSIVGWVDAKNQKVHSLKIPSALSFLTYRNLTTAVTGLDQIPKEEWPNVAVVFQTYHVMILCWVVLFFLTCYALYLNRKRKLEKAKYLLRALIFSVFLPQIALQAGWISTEMGRQPWIVHKLLKTSEGVSLVLSASQVRNSIFMFCFLCILLFSLFILLLDRKIKHGPDMSLKEEAIDTTEIYSDPYKKWER